MYFKLSLCVLLLLVCSFETRGDSNEDVPLTTFGSKTGPTLKIFYCYSCGYRKIYEDYVTILRQKYPELPIEGENYNPPGFNMLITKVLSTAKILVIILILSGINIFQWIGHPAPFQWLIDNRIYSCVMLFFVCNALESQLISSGAFEIHFNDVPVWSKLETGRIPQPPELFQIIDNHLHMMFPEMDSGKISFNK